MVSGILISFLHPTPRFFDEGWVRLKEGLHLQTSLRHSSIPVYVENASDMESQVSDPRLDYCYVSSQGDPPVDGMPSCVVDPPLFPFLHPRRFGDCLAEICKDRVYAAGFPVQAQRDFCALSEVALVRPPSSNAEAPQDHLMVGIVTGVPGRHFPEQMKVCT